MRNGPFTTSQVRVEDGERSAVPAVKHETVHITVTDPVGPLKGLASRRSAFAGIEYSCFTAHDITIELNELPFDFRGRGISFNAGGHAKHG